MSKDLEEQIEYDIKTYFRNSENMSHQDRVEALRNLLKKHVHLSTCDHVMDDYSLREIIGTAKSKMANDRVPIHLGEKKRKVDPNQLPNFMVIEATMQYLHKHKCFVKVPRFDKREDVL